MNNITEISLFMIFIINIAKVSSLDQPSLSVFEKVRSGLKFAGKLLNLDRASKVANLVSQAFRKFKIRKGDGKPAASDNGIFTGFLRILGFDAKKIGAIAVNAIIFLAQLLGTSLSVKPPSNLSTARKSNSKPNASENPFSWMLENSEVIGMITQATDKNLPEKVMEQIKERFLDEETGCIQMLICKTAPFVWGMQRALSLKRNETVKTGESLFYEHMPTVEDVTRQSDLCENRHHYCFQDLL